jgi:hypothetical protein
MHGRVIDIGAHPDANVAWSDSAPKGSPSSPGQRDEATHFVVIAVTICRAAASAWGNGATPLRWNTNASTRTLVKNRVSTGLRPLVTIRVAMLGRGLRPETTISAPTCRSWSTPYENAVDRIPPESGNPPCSCRHAFSFATLSGGPIDAVALRVQPHAARLAIRIADAVRSVGRRSDMPSAFEGPPHASCMIEKPQDNRDHPDWARPWPRECQLDRADHVEPPTRQLAHAEQTAQHKLALPIGVLNLAFGCHLYLVRRNAPLCTSTFTLSWYAFQTLLVLSVSYVQSACAQPAPATIRTAASVPLTPNRR